MARRGGPGKDFDDQFNQSKRRGEEKARKGESHWAEDKYLERLNQRLGSGQANHGDGGRGARGCRDKAMMVLVLFSSAIWGLSETVSRVVG